MVGNVILPSIAHRRRSAILTYAPLIDGNA